MIEEFLGGEEFSLLAFVDGENVYPMVIAQDHKRAYDGDAGPNTGGMGAYSPVPQIPDSMVAQAVEEVLHPTIQGMIQRGTPYRGILYAGLIATVEGPKVIEFNARFGDPETQVVLARLESSLVDIITALLAHETPEIKWNEKASVGVVVASQGYPGDYVNGAVLPDFSNEETSVFYAGVAEENQTLVSQGGECCLLKRMHRRLRKHKKKCIKRLRLLIPINCFIDVTSAIKH